MKRQKITKWIFLLAMVLMVSVLGKTEIARANEQDSKNYHLIPCDDGQSGMYRPADRKRQRPGK